MRRVSVLSLVAAIVIGGIACERAPESSAVDWGPLAVTKGRFDSELLTTGGIVRITADCVFVETRTQGFVLLVWWQGTAHWDAATRLIRHRDNEGPEELRSGDSVSLGGSREHVPDWSDWVGRIDWTAPPKPACETPTVWYVGAIAKK